MFCIAKHQKSDIYISLIFLFGFLFCYVVSMDYYRKTSRSSHLKNVTSFLLHLSHFQGNPLLI